MIFGCFSTAESTWEAPADYVEPSESENKSEDVSAVAKTETESDTKPAPAPVEVCIVISLEFVVHGFSHSLTPQEVPIGVWRVTRVITAEEKAIEKAAKVN
jgi:hypothetical protein